LGKFRGFGLAVLFLVVAMRIKRVPHLEKLKIPLKLRRQVRTRKIVPGRASGGLLLLQSCVSANLGSEHTMEAQASFASE